MMSDVRSRLEVVGQGPLIEPSELDHSDVMATNRHASDEYLLSSSGFTQPMTLRYGTVSATGADPIKQEPDFFDASGLAVRQFFATSADGTPVPYFVVGPPEGGPGPTLLSGYGGFEVSRTPYYSGIIGRGWLARGGTYVLANLRGGGEYGPDWHRSAMRENRIRAYEDFTAVATDLVARGITTREQLGIEGASNGGLLIASC